MHILLSRLFHCFLLFCYLNSTVFNAYGGFEDSDTRFEVNAQEKKISLKLYDHQNVLLDTTLDLASQSVLEGKGYKLKRYNDGYQLNYKGDDQSRLSLLIDWDGNVTFREAIDTNFAQKKVWGIKTNATLISPISVLFYYIYTQAHAFHNFGLFKAYSGHFRHSYYFNRGVLHFGDTSDTLAIRAYVDFLEGINPSATPNFAHNTIDDYGLLLSHNNLKISGLKYRACGMSDLDQLILKKGASIEVQKVMTVHQDITGKAESISIEDQGVFTVGSILPITLRLNNWNNMGYVHFSDPTEILTEDSYNNKGMIFSTSNFAFSSKKKMVNMGRVASMGEVRAAVLEAQDHDHIKGVLHDSRLFAKKEKIIILIKILNHYFFPPKRTVTTFPNSVTTVKLFSES